jgi:hypothetical protein
MSFIGDLHKQLANQIQLTTDGFHFYTKAVPEVFGLDVDFAQLVKLFGDYGQHDEGRYSPPRITETISKRFPSTFPATRYLSHYRFLNSHAC